MAINQVGSLLSPNKRLMWLLLLRWGNGQKAWVDNKIILHHLKSPFKPLRMKSPTHRKATLAFPWTISQNKEFRLLILERLRKTIKEITSLLGNKVIKSFSPPVRQGVHQRKDMSIGCYVWSWQKERNEIKILQSLGWISTMLARKRDNTSMIKRSKGKGSPPSVAPHQLWCICV